MADPERIDEPSRKDRTARLNGAGEVLQRGFTEAVDRAQPLQRRLVPRQAEDVGGSARSAPPPGDSLELLLAQPLDVEGACGRRTCFRCSSRWNGQANSPVQRRTTVSRHRVCVVSFTTGVFKLQGQICRDSRTAAAPRRFESVGIDGAERPAGSRRPRAGSRTVSPIRTSLRAISSALCRVALRTTVAPPTVTGLQFARPGVSEPVRPTWMSIPSSTVLRLLGRETCAPPPSAGMRPTAPSRPCQSSRSTL